MWGSVLLYRYMETIEDQDRQDADSTPEDGDAAPDVQPATGLTGADQRVNETIKKINELGGSSPDGWGGGNHRTGLGRGW